MARKVLGIFQERDRDDSFWKLALAWKYGSWWMRAVPFWDQQISRWNFWKHNSWELSAHHKRTLGPGPWDPGPGPRALALFFRKTWSLRPCVLVGFISWNRMPILLVRFPSCGRILRVGGTLGVLGRKCRGLSAVDEVPWTKMPWTKMKWTKWCCAVGAECLSQILAEIFEWQYASEQRSEEHVWLCSPIRLAYGGF